MATSADEKFKALEAAGVKTVRSLAEIGKGLREITGWQFLSNSLLFYASQKSIPALLPTFLLKL